MCCARSAGASRAIEASARTAAPRCAAHTQLRLRVRRRGVAARRCAEAPGRLLRLSAWWTHPRGFSAGWSWSGAPEWTSGAARRTVVLLLPLRPKRALPSNRSQPEQALDVKGCNPRWPLLRAAARQSECRNCRSRGTPHTSASSAAARRSQPFRRRCMHACIPPGIPPGILHMSAMTTTVPCTCRARAYARACKKRPLSSKQRRSITESPPAMPAA